MEQKYYFLESAEGLIYCTLSYSKRSTADWVVFCYPIGQEYIRAYSYCQYFSDVYWEKGFNVAKFDYAGTGNSSGTEEMWSIDRWLNNMELIINHIYSIANNARISLFGLRFGASLAIIYNSKFQYLYKIVAIDPLFEGNEYLKEMNLENESWKEKAFSSNIEDNKIIEIIGFKLTSAFMEELRGLNIDKTKIQKTNMLLVQSSKNKLLSEEFAPSCPSVMIFNNRVNWFLKTEMSLAKIKMAKSIGKWISFHA